MLRVGGLFSGVGGLELGIENAWKACGYGVTTRYQVELDDRARAVLHHHWPSAVQLSDITQIDPARLPPVDLICGGFPCQDLSVAGRGAGIEHGKRSSLWKNFKEILRVQHPALVIVENVNHGRERWLPTVTSDLASLGYTCVAYRVAAGDLGAPHERARAFVLAHADRESLRKLAERLPRRRTGVLRRPWETQSRPDGHPWLASIASSWSAPPRVQRVDDGLPAGMDRRAAAALNKQREARLKMLGNAVSPPVAFAVALEQIRLFEAEVDAGMVGGSADAWRDELLSIALSAPRSVVGPQTDSPRAGARESWTRIVPVPLRLLASIPARATRHLQRRVSGEERLDSLRMMRVHPPIEIAVAPDGRVRLMDGNHRLIVARERGAAAVDVAFLLTPKSDDRYV